uniref:Uncharacterized protein n=1 Tax=Oryza punctata TaxID=4537 RepID=A0A0E0JMD8_ORYPU
MEFSVDAAVEASALSVMDLVSENILGPSTFYASFGPEDPSDASFDPEDPACVLSFSVLPDRLGRRCPAGGVEGPTSSPAAFLLSPARSSGILPPAGVRGVK